MTRLVPCEEIGFIFNPGKRKQIPIETYSGHLGWAMVHRGDKEWDLVPRYMASRYEEEHIYCTVTEGSDTVVAGQRLADGSYSAVSERAVLEGILGCWLFSSSSQYPLAPHRCAFGAHPEHPGEPIVEYKSSAQIVVGSKIQRYVGVINPKPDAVLRTVRTRDLTRLRNNIAETSAAIRPMLSLDSAKALLLKLHEQGKIGGGLLFRREFNGQAYLNVRCPTRAEITRTLGDKETPFRHMFGANVDTGHGNWEDMIVTPDSKQQAIHDVASFIAAVGFFTDYTATTDRLTKIITNSYYLKEVSPLPTLQTD